MVAEGAEFDLLVTDVRMPVMSGPDLSGELEKSLPGLRTLFVSGWPGAPDPLADRPSRLLGKPFTAEALLGAVADLLAG
jgi:CheY-like chemotaxis protein